MPRLPFIEKLTERNRRDRGGAERKWDCGDTSKVIKFANHQHRKTEGNAGIARMNFKPSAR